MTEKSDNNEPTSQKLFIDNPFDFQFHAAYLAYSGAYDKATDPETKKQLNENIKALQQNQIDYPTFYKSINQYRVEDGYQYRHGRTFIKTQKKQEWRRETQKRERNKRHGR